LDAPAQKFGSVDLYDIELRPNLTSFRSGYKLAESSRAEQTASFQKRVSASISSRHAAQLFARFFAST